MFKHAKTKTTSRYALTSMIGFDARIFFSICVSESDPLMVAKYLMAYLADTVFPAPDSPETIILWSLFSLETNNVSL